MADNLCTVEANGTTLTCACSGCGIVYNHETKKYHILCCGTITEMSVENQTDDPNNPPRPGQLVVNFAGITLLQAAQLLDRSAPGKVRIDLSFKQLRKEINLKANEPLARLTKKLGLNIASK